MRWRGCSTARSRSSPGPVRAWAAASHSRVATEGARVVVLGRTVSKCEAVVGRDRSRAAARRPPIAVRRRAPGPGRGERRHGWSTQWGRIDLLVNNAQTKVYRSIRKLTDGDMETMWQSGPMGALAASCRPASPTSRDSKGCVVNMGSGSSILPHAAMSRLRHDQGGGAGAHCHASARRVGPLRHPRQRHLPARRLARCSRVRRRRTRRADEAVLPDDPARPLG